MDPSSRGPRSAGGLAVYLLALPAVVVTLAAPGLVVAAALGAVTALAVRKLSQRRRQASTGTQSRTAVPRTAKSP